MTVTDGMDVERVRSIAQQLLSQSTKIDDVRTSGEGQISVLEGAWSGPDLEKFQDGWDSAMPQLDHAGADGEVDTCDQAQPDQRYRPDETVGGVDEFGE